MIKTIAVLGAGTMGHGIAHAAMVAGYQTYLYDISPTQLDIAEAFIVRARRIADSFEMARASQRGEIAGPRHSLR